MGMLPSKNTASQSAISLLSFLLHLRRHFKPSIQSIWAYRSLQHSGCSSTSFYLFIDCDALSHLITHIPLGYRSWRLFSCLCSCFYVCVLEAQFLTPSLWSIVKMKKTKGMSRQRSVFKPRRRVALHSALLKQSVLCNMLIDQDQNVSSVVINREEQTANLANFKNTSFLIGKLTIWGYRT